LAQQTFEAAASILDAHDASGHCDCDLCQDAAFLLYAVRTFNDMAEGFPLKSAQKKKSA
jgi:hypothetical protein